MKKITFRFSVLATLLLSLRTLSSPACDFCMLGQGVSPYMTANGRGLTLGVDYRELNRVYEKTHTIPSTGKKEAWTVFSLTGFYAVNEDFMVLATLPFVSKTNIDYDDASNTNPGTLTTGIADLSLTTRYTVLRKHTLETTWILGLLAGVKLPTGSTQSREQSGAIVDRHALPGTGSWDFDLGVSGSYASASGVQFTFDGVYRISTSGKWGDQTHQYGNMLNYGAKGFYRVLKTETGTTLMPFLGASGETTGKEKGITDPTTAVYDGKLSNPSTGGTVLFGDVGLYSQLNPTTIATLGFSKAFYHDMNFSPDYDADPAEDYKLNFSLTYSF